MARRSATKTAKAKAKPVGKRKTRKQAKKRKKSAVKKGAKVSAPGKSAGKPYRYQGPELLDAAVSLDLAESAPHYASLSEEVRAVAMAEFTKHVDRSDLNGLIPSDIAVFAVLDGVCRSLYLHFQTEPWWKIDPSKFQTGGDVLLRDIQQKQKDEPHAATVSWLIADIYHYVLAARMASRQP
jgi:hypothetical protein